MNTPALSFPHAEARTYREQPQKKNDLLFLSASCTLGVRLSVHNAGSPVVLTVACAHSADGEAEAQCGQEIGAVSLRDLVYPGRGFRYLWS